MKIYIALINASLKMYFRNKQSLIWAMFFPLVLMIILGSYNFYRYTPPKIGIENLAQNSDSEILINHLENQNIEKIVQFKYDNKNNSLKSQLLKGDLTALITIPNNFILDNNSNKKIKFEFNNPPSQSAHDNEKNKYSMSENNPNKFFLLKVSIGQSMPLIITIINLSIVSIMGGILFISMGLAISGWSRTEDTAAPMANLVTLPMMFLSGVFFPITSLPSWVKYFSQFLPLTFLSDALRQITLDGNNFFDIIPQLTGLLIWIIITFILASRVFKWE